MKHREKRMSNPIQDTLWMRAFWHIYGEQSKEHGIYPVQQTGTVEFKDVDNLILEWSKYPIDQLMQALAGINED